MGILLEITAGPSAGKKIALSTGKTLTFGRADGRADIPFPKDTFMSGVHFALECGASGCRVQDRKSSNGTFLNGAKIQDAMLANGDEIKAGQTVFVVKIVADSKIASLNQPDASASRPTSSQPEVLARQPAVRPGSSCSSGSEPDAPPPRATRKVPALETPAAVAGAIREQAVPSEAGKQQIRPPSKAESSSSPGMPPPFAKPGVASMSSPRQQPAPASEAKPSGFANASQPASASENKSAFQVSGWSFPTVPPHWQAQEGFGLQQTGVTKFPSSLSATEESLGAFSLPQFVEFQINTLRNYLRDPKIAPAMPPPVAGTDETMAVNVTYATKDGQELVYHRIYARSGSSVGVLTVTTLAADLPKVLQALEPALTGAAFRSATRTP